MKLENGTGLPAHLFSGPAGPTTLGCALLLKATWEVAGETLRRVDDGAWPIHLEPLKTPYGVFPGEVANRKPKMDLIVLGRARAPRGEAVGQMSVSVALGSFRHSLTVFGDRRWERTAAGLRPSAPVPFLEMPIVWANAFGGKLATSVGDMPNTDNPEGKGFVRDDADAVGTPLPNLEDPAALIRTPGDLPKPVGWGPYPIAGGLRVARWTGPNGAPLPFAQAEPYVMGWAHPALILDVPAAGTPVEVRGLSPDGPIATKVPGAPARARLLVGETRTDLPFRLDTLIIQAEERRLVARWRASATFEMRPRETRMVRVEPA